MPRSTNRDSQPSTGLGIPRRLAFAGALGLVLTGALYRFGLGVSLPDYPLDRTEIVERARAVAALRGAETTGLLMVVVTADRDRFVETFGVEETRRASLARELPVPAWVVRFRDPATLHRGIDADPRGVMVTLGETGDLIRAAFPEPRRTEPAPESSEARRIAAEALAALGVDLTHFEPADEDASGRTDEQQVTATERRLRWERPIEGRPDVRHVVSATVTASGLTYFERTTDSGPAIERRGLAVKITEVIVCIVLWITLAALAAGLVVFRIVDRDYVSIRRAFLAGVAVAAASCTSAVLGADLAESAALSVGFVGLAAGVVVGIVAALAWLVGETDAFHAWGRRSLEGSIALVRGRVLTRQVARETAEGFLWGSAFLGALAFVAAVVAIAAGPDAVIAPSNLYPVEGFVPALYWARSLPGVLMLWIVGSLFVAPWTNLVIVRPVAWTLVAGPLVGVIAFSCGIVDVRFGPVSGIVAWALPFGLMTCWVAKRRGALTAASAGFAAAALFFGIPALVTGGGGRASAALGLALAALPAGLALAFGRRLPDAAAPQAPPPRRDAAAERMRWEQDLDIARRVQTGLLPQRAPELSGFEIAGACRPAREVGGDYFDYFSRADGTLGIALGDVSGKGVPAAFFMTLTKSLLEVEAAEEREPHRVLSQTNAHLRPHLVRTMFVTMAYVLLDPERRSAILMRAGHTLPVYVPAGSDPAFVTSPGAPLGVPPADFNRLAANHEIELGDGGALVLYSDGVTEAMNPEGEQFGEERLLATLARCDAHSAAEIVSIVFEDVATFSAGADQHDDITVVVIKAL